MSQRRNLSTFRRSSSHKSARSSQTHTSCEVCTQYERQLRDIETDLDEAMLLTSDVSAHTADLILRLQRVTELQFQVEAAKLVFDRHRRREQ